MTQSNFKPSRITSYLGCYLWFKKWKFNTDKTQITQYHAYVISLYDSKVEEAFIWLSQVLNNQKSQAILDLIYDSKSGTFNV